MREPSPGRYTVTIGDVVHKAQWLEQSEDRVRVLIDGVQLNVGYAFTGRGEVVVQLRGEARTLTNELAFTLGDLEHGGSGTVVAPMHGNVIDVMVAVGDRVQVGQDLAVMEAMKMEHRLTAEVAGEVTAVHAAVGDQIAADSIVLEIEAEE